VSADPAALSNLSAFSWVGNPLFLLVLAVLLLRFL
jgi:hypothetical protein